MLAPVTRQYKDLSTPERFQFVLYCDCCGKEWKSDVYVFNMKGFDLPIDEKIRSMLWNQQHEEAYERANCEAGVRYNRCPVCGCRICDDCFEHMSQEGCNICKNIKNK